MATGDLSASTLVLCSGPTEVHDAIETLNLPSVTDKLIVVPIPNSPDQFYVGSVTIEA